MAQSQWGDTSTCHVFPYWVPPKSLTWRHALLAQTQPGASYWGHWSRAVTSTTATGPGPAGSHIHILWVALTQASYSAVSPNPNQAINHIHAPTPWVSLSFLLCYLSKPSQDPHWGISWTSPYLTLPLKCPDTPATTEPEWPSLSSKNSTLSICRAHLVILLLT